MAFASSNLMYSVESSKLWKWEKNSMTHRNRFIKLLEYGRDDPQRIEEINDVRVCFEKEFLIGRGSDATRVYVGLSKDGYERAVKRLVRDDCGHLAEHEKKILNEPNVRVKPYCKISLPRRQKQQELGISYHGLVRRNVERLC